MITTKNLSKRYGDKLAVDDLTFSVAPGEVLGFLGANGAGKSTTMRMIAGFISPTAGQVSVCGHDIERAPVAAKSCMGYLPEGAPSYGEMTVSEFLDFVADVRGLTGDRRRQRRGVVVDRLGLAPVIEQVIETLSKGFRRRVGLAQALIHDPQVLILDEPTDGLDPNQKHEVRRLINELSKDKLVIVSTHILEEVHEVCTRAIIIADGRIVADETPTALEARSRYHHAVSLRFEKPAELEAARARIALLPEVAEVESDARELRLTAVPKPGANTLSAVSALITENDWDVPELHLESGRLDEVFRALTQPPRIAVSDTAQGASAVSDVLVIFRRELRSYFATPLAYVFIVIFLVLAAVFTFQVGGFFERGQADLQPFFRWHPWLYLVLIPAISMRLWAEERNSGSIELLMTLPITLWQAVVGKFLAAWCFAGIALLLTFPIWITVNYLGSPDNGAIFAAYLGSLLMAGGFLAIGMCLSAATRNQVVAFITAALVGFVFLLAGFPLVLDFVRGILPQAIVDAIASLSFFTHFEAISKGVIDVRDLVYFGALIGFWLAATALVLDMKKAE